MRDLYNQTYLRTLWASKIYVIVHEHIGHNVQKRENMQHHNSETTMSPELILGMARAKLTAATILELYMALQSLPKIGLILPDRVQSHVTRTSPTYCT